MYIVCIFCVQIHRIYTEYTHDIHRIYTADTAQTPGKQQENWAWGMGFLEEIFREVGFAVSGKEVIWRLERKVKKSDNNLAALLSGPGMVGLWVFEYILHKLQVLADPVFSHLHIFPNCNSAKYQNIKISTLHFYPSHKYAISKRWLTRRWSPMLSAMD